MKKRRSDSKIDKLPENQRAALETWLFEENISYDAALKRLFEDFNFRCSRSCLGEWRSARADVRMLDAIVQRAQKANAVQEVFEKNPSESYSALLNMIGQFAFQMQVDGGEKPSLEVVERIAGLMEMGLKAQYDSAQLRMKERDLELKERRVKLLEQKAALAEAAEGTMRDGSLSEEEKQQRLKAIFGIN